jgi:serine/threonine protein kinase
MYRSNAVAITGMTESAVDRIDPRRGDPDRDLIEQEVGHQYQVVRPLGRGGMGSVYLARDKALHRVVAIKALRWDRFSNAEDRDRFRREARMGAQLSHPNIIPLLTFGETPNLMYMVLRYVQGESLAARIAREGTLRTGEAQRILIELTHALEYAHRQGVVHRDLKPENILLETTFEPDGREGPARPIVADFGVAMVRMRDPIPGERRRSFGTPQFMSPEQAAGEPDLDGRSDIYSLGVLGYLMLGGALPYRASSISGENADGRAFSPTGRAPRALGPIIERCLAPDPDARYPSARDLRRALEGRRRFWIF